MIRAKSVDSETDGPDITPFECVKQGSQKCKLRCKRGSRICTDRFGDMDIHCLLFTGCFDLVVYRVGGENRCLGSTILHALDGHFAHISSDCSTYPHDYICAIHGFSVSFMGK